jgi:hypothetical protein
MWSMDRPSRPTAGAARGDSSTFIMSAEEETVWSQVSYAGGFVDKYGVVFLRKPQASEL